MKQLIVTLRSRAVGAAGGALLLLSFALVLNAWFSIQVLESLHYGETAAKFRVTVVKLQRDLQAELRFGQGLSPNTGMEQRLLAARTMVLETVGLATQPGRAPQRIGLSVLSAEGEVLSSTTGRGIVRPLPETLLQKFLELRHDEGSEWGYRLNGQTLYLLLPLRGVDGQWGGALAVEIDGGNVLAGARFFDELATIVGAIVLAGIALLTVFVGRALFDFSRGNPVSRRSFTVCCLLVLFGVQVASTTLCVSAFSNEYINLSRDSAQATVNIVKHEVEPMLALGISLRHVADLEPMLADLLSLNPELGTVQLRAADGTLLAEQSNDDMRETASTSLGVLAARLLGLTDREGGAKVRAALRASGTPVATVEATVPERRVYTHIYDLVGETFTVLAVTLLLGGELVVLALLLMERRNSKQPTRVETRFSGARPAMFFFLFGIDLSMSFVALHMEELYEPMLGLSKEFVIGLPISVEFFFVGVAILTAGVWVDRRGWLQPFVVGLVLAAGGTLYGGLATDAWHFIISRAILGLGYGLTLLAIQGYVIRSVDEKNITQGLAHVFAGLYAGSLCGNAFGAMLADSLGYQAVFLIGAAVLGSLTLIALLFLRQPAPAAASAEAASPAAVVASEPGGLRRFLLDRRVASVMLLASMPAAVVTVGFLNYFAPLYLHDLGATQTTIGQVLLVYGIALVFVGPALSRAVDAAGNRRLAVFIGSLLGGIALLVFQVMEGLTATLLAMALLGVSSALVLSAQSALLLSLPAAQGLGKSTAMGIFRASSRIGQVMGPIVVAAVVVTMGAGKEHGIAIIGLVYVLVSLAFLLTSGERRRGEQGGALPDVATAGPG